MVKSFSFHYGHPARSTCLFRRSDAPVCFSGLVHGMTGSSGCFSELFYSRLMGLGFVFFFAVHFFFPYYNFSAGGLRAMFLYHSGRFMQVDWS